MTILDTLQTRARAWDEARPRSTQKAVGWSEVGGCRSHIGYRLLDTWNTDEPDTWAAIRGTVLGDFLETLLDGDSELTQIDTEYRGIPGHADILLLATALYDLKTTSLAASKAWRSDPAVLLQKRIQTMGYTAGLVAQGKLPEDCKVGLIVIPVDGKFSDWWLWEEEFDRSLADQGADRLAWVQQRLASGGWLPKDKPFSWCQSWCEFFSLCRGGDDPLASEKIEDPETAAMIRLYGEAVEQASAADKVKKSLGPQIRGLRGMAGEWRVSYSKPSEPGEALDEPWIRADYADRGLEVPVIPVPAKAPNMYVKRVKK